MSNTKIYKLASQNIAFTIAEAVAHYGKETL